MAIATKVTVPGRLLGIAAVLLCWLSVFSIVANAQGSGNLPGQNAACSSSSGCATQAGSSAFFDASMFVSNQNPNICAVLNFVLNPASHVLPTGATFIDARGLNSTNTSMTCAISPWKGILTTVAVDAG
jgi:hypothetical protein